MLTNVFLRSRQAARYARLAANLGAGSAFIQSCFQFPSVSKIDQRHLNDYSVFNLWVDDLARSMNTRVHVSGSIMSEEGLFVANHISWLDTIVLNKIKTLSFIARHDLEGWPFLGTFTRRMHSVYINRDNKFQAYRSIPAIEARLNENRSVLVFPESTTSDGGSLLPFYPMFYEAAVRTGRPVQPVSLKYTDCEGNLLRAPAFIDDDTFFDTLNRIFLTDKVHAHVTFLPPLDSKKMCRKELSRVSKEMILAHR